MAETTQKYGVVLRCPNCGDPVKAGATKCDCGFEFVGVAANATITALSQRFVEIEEAVDKKDLSPSERNNEIIVRKGDAIRELPIPNSRDDLHALIAHILPKAKADSTDPNADAWRGKLGEVLIRAKTAYKGDAKARAEFEDIEKSLGNTFTGSIQAKAKRSPFVTIGVVVALLLAVLGVIGTQMDKWKIKRCEDQYEQGAIAEKKRLEEILNTVDAFQKEKKFSDAVVALNKLRWELQSECKTSAAGEARTLWDTKRSEMLLLVQKNEAESTSQQKADSEREEATKRAEEEKIAAAEKEQQARAAAQQRAVAASQATTARKAAVAKEW